MLFNQQSEINNQQFFKPSGQSLSKSPPALPSTPRRTQTSASPSLVPSAPFPNARAQISRRDAPSGRSTAATLHDKIPGETPPATSLPKSYHPLNRRC